MRKKAIIVAVFLVLVGFLAVNGTLAQELENIFKTIANIANIANGTPENNETQLKVVLVNQDRNGNAVSDTTLYPVHCADDYAWATVPTNVNSGTYDLWDSTQVSGALDKFVRVQNVSTGEGAKDACFCLAFAVDAQIFSKLKLNFNRSSGDYLWENAWSDITIEGRPYKMMIATYMHALAPNAISSPALLQLALQKDVSNADLAGLGQDFLRTMVMAVDADTLTPEGGSRPSAIETLNTTLPIDEGTFNPF